ncbi:hypothetical protein PRIPAC_93254 [Pristionchus pacificus]|uniref:Uncharacterized protein n=1 Tax=Pristionchus pacificus TaxID=54126 RepID=A0A2A6CI05_PRIPA|nr:hypothetical protein PRIPAC_93254 [Pristionchus pacificus]|eukprot:PDM77832.1 hypothetical protein PRIPAC_34699 [Pristionchus pacificus]
MTSRKRARTKGTTSARKLDKLPEPQRQPQSEADEVTEILRLSMKAASHNNNIDAAATQLRNRKEKMEAEKVLLETLAQRFGGIGNLLTAIHTRQFPIVLDAQNPLFPQRT